MCGIFGWQFNEKAKIPAVQLEVMAGALAISNSLRGDESWGVFMRSDVGKTRLMKEVGDIARVEGVAHWGSVRTVMAHTRFSTHGKVTKENAHPFTVGKITLAHNGVIFNHEELNRKHDRECEVDSLHFAMHMSEGKSFSEIEGYGSLEWVHEDSPASVFLCRMAGGSLSAYGVRNAKGKQVGTVWSSDENHLIAALDSAHLDSFEYRTLEEGVIYEIIKGRLFETREPKLELRESSGWNFGFQRWNGHTSGRAYGSDDHSYITSPSGLKYYPPTPDVEDDDKDVAISDEEITDYAKRSGLTPTGNGLWVTEGGEVKDRDEVEEMLFDDLYKAMSKREAEEADALKGEFKGGFSEEEEEEEQEDYTAAAWPRQARKVGGGK